MRKGEELHRLVAEWTEEPATTNPFLKTVTETRVVGGFHRFESSHAVVEIKENRNGAVYIQTEHYYDKQSIAELARILAEISEVM